MAIQIFSYRTEHEILSILNNDFIYSPTKVDFKDDIAKHRGSLLLNKTPLIINRACGYQIYRAVLVPDNTIVKNARVIFKNLRLHYNSKKVFKCVLVSIDACEEFQPMKKIYIPCLYDDMEFIKNFPKIIINPDYSINADVSISNETVTIL
jgi:hypothetical protein